MQRNETQNEAPLLWRFAIFVVRAGDVLAALFLFLMMLVAFVDVLGRSLVNSPLRGATEITELLVAATVCAALPSLTLYGRHVTIDILNVVIGRRLGRLLTVAGALVGAVAFAVIAWRLWIDAAKTARSGGMTPLWEIPMGPVLQVIAGLAGLTAIAFLLTLYRGNWNEDD